MAVWQEEEAGRCSGCGTYEWEHEDEDGLPWSGAIHLCKGCEAIDMLKAKVGKEHSPENMAGWRLRLIKEVD